MSGYSVEFYVNLPYVTEADALYYALDGKNEAQQAEIVQRYREIFEQKDIDPTELAVTEFSSLGFLIATIFPEISSRITFWKEVALHKEKYPYQVIVERPRVKNT